MYCPDVHGECKKEQCVYWYNKINDCTIRFNALHEADMNINSDEYCKVGLESVHKKLSNILSSNYMNLLYRSSDINDNDKTLIKKLYTEGTEKQNLLDIKKDINKL